MALSALGYEAAHLGGGRWNAGAILSRVGLREPVYGCGGGGPPDPEARVLSARCGGVPVVTTDVAHGRPRHEQHYRYRHACVARLHPHIRARAKPGDEVLLCGDFNVAASDHD